VAGDYVCHALADFAVPPDPNERWARPASGDPPRYSIVREPGRSRTSCTLLFGDTVLTSTDAKGAVNHLLWHVFEEAIWWTGDYFLVHAGSVVTPSGEAVIVPGDPGAGKTTLVAGLVRAGFGYLSDEAAAIDPVRGRVHPHPRALSFKRPPGEVLPGITARDEASPFLDGRWLVRSEEIRPGSLARPAPVRYVVATRYERDAPTVVEEMTPAQAVTMLARCSLNLPVYRSRALYLLADVVRGARCYGMRSGSLEEAIRTVEGLTGTYGAGGPAT
jgi:hypothetical protein